MALKRPLALFRLPSSSSPSPFRQPTSCCRRHLHRLNAPTHPIPKPTPFVPDVPTFLTLIGRKLSQHSSKIPSWESLFRMSSAELREAGVEPPRARRYLLWWRERFRNGLIGIGGDLSHVRDGVGELSIVQVPSKWKRHASSTISTGPGMRKMVVNTAPPPVAADTAQESAPVEGEEGDSAKSEKKVAKIVRRSAMAPLPIVAKDEAKSIVGVSILNGTAIAGRGVQPVKGRPGVARLKVREGLWEQKRGTKPDGGERRRAMVRAKRRALERKNA